MFPLILIWFGCSAATNLPEDLLATTETPPGERYDTEPPVDFGETGIRISPSVEHVLAPARLLVQNTRNETVICEVFEDPMCDALPFVDELEVLEPGETWNLLDVECALVDIACLPADADDRTLPYRTWSWFVQPVED